MYKFVGRKNQYYEYNIKMDANCPASEKSGEGPGSCGGAKPGEKSENSVSDAPKKGGGFLGKLFGGGKDEGTLTISKHDGKKL